MSEKKSNQNEGLKDKIQKHFYKYTPVYVLLIVGIGAYLSGVIIYKFLQFSNRGAIQFEPARPDLPPTFQDLATVLTGTVGLIFTVAGIFALLHTIFQTKHEMKESRDIFSRQLIDNTFFNLLHNHKSTILQSEQDIERFKKQIKSVEDDFTIYVAHAKSFEFDSFKRTFSIPSEIYNEDVYDLVKAVGRSIKHLVEFVELKIAPNDLIKSEEIDFYHQTIYNTLSDSERYLVGMMIQGNIIKAENTSLRGIYSEYFLKNSALNSVNIWELLPPVSIATTFQHHTHFRNMDDNEANENLVSHATTFSPYSKNKEVTFIVVNYNFSFENQKGEKTKGSGSFKITGSERRISLLPAFKDQFYKIFKEHAPTVIDVGLIFNVGYRKAYYDIKAGFTVRLIMQYLGKDEISEHRQELNDFLDRQKIEKCFYLVIKTK